MEVDETHGTSLNLELGRSGHNLNKANEKDDDIAGGRGLRLGQVNPEEQKP